MKQSFDFSAIGKYLKMSPNEKRARLALINRVIDKKTPIPMNEAAVIINAELGTGGEKMLAGLIDKAYVSPNDDNEIAFLYPVSAVPTNHRVRLLDGREFNTMCAFDALGCAVTFNMPIEVFSVTNDTGEPVYARITPAGIESIEPTGLYVSYYDSWAEGAYNY